MSRIRPALLAPPARLARRGRLGWLAKLGLLLLAGFTGSALLQAVAAPPKGGQPAPASRAQVSSPAPVVALLGGRPGGIETTLHLVVPGARVLPAAVARFEHPPWAVVRGGVTPWGEVLVTVDGQAAREISFGSRLLALEPSGPAAGGRWSVRALCDRLAYAARPLVTASGRVFVERGRPGLAAVGSDQLRIDQLSVDEVVLGPPVETRNVHAWRGYTTHLAGFLGSEVIVYRVGPAGADIVAVDVDSGGLRRLLPASELEPMARDFSVDGEGRLIFVTHDSRARLPWVVDRMSIASGERVRLWSGRGSHPVPHAWAGSLVALNPDGDQGLAVVGRGRGGESIGRLLSPAGTGMDVVRGLSSDSAWAAVLHFSTAGGLPRPLLLGTGDGAAVRLPVVLLPVEAGVRYEIAGFLRGER